MRTFRELEDLIEEACQKEALQMAAGRYRDNHQGYVESVGFIRGLRRVVELIDVLTKKERTNAVTENGA